MVLDLRLKSKKAVVMTAFCFCVFREAVSCGEKMNGDGFGVEVKPSRGL